MCMPECALQILVWEGLFAPLLQRLFEPLPQLHYSSLPLSWALSDFPHPADFAGHEQGTRAFL